VAESSTRFGAGPKWALPTVLYFAVAVTVHFIHYPQFVIRQLAWGSCVAIAASLVLSGATVYLSALIPLRRALKERRLITSGLYSVVRHPLYASSILLILPGVALLVRSWLLLPMPAVAYIAAHAYIPAEDAQLRGRFGNAFDRYQRTTNALVPRLWHRDKPG
jgi:protein-S-isoprenylcysteine O-methyltransferase Ste14